MFVSLTGENERKEVGRKSRIVTNDIELFGTSRVKQWKERRDDEKAARIEEDCACDGLYAVWICCVRA